MHGIDVTIVRECRNGHFLECFLFFKHSGKLTYTLLLKFLNINNVTHIFSKFLQKILIFQNYY